MEILGIDIGGSGIKGAPVDVEHGVLTADRLRIETPQPATPDAVADVVAQIARHFNWEGPIGCALPAVVKGGTVLSAAHIAESWIGLDGQSILSEKTGCPLVLLNDADAAGIAEMVFGAGKDQPGLVLIVTLGTGIGSALFYQSTLIPNTELGHLEVRGKDAERRASDRARKKKDLSWKRWAANVDEYLDRLDALFSPDLFIIGGGVSKEFEQFGPRLHTRAPVVAAALENEAGIVGAALAASGQTLRRPPETAGEDRHQDRDADLGGDLDSLVSET